MNLPFGTEQNGEYSQQLKQYITNMKKILIIIMLICSLYAGATNYYVATAANGGSDSKTGLIGQPVLTLANACTKALVPGDVINIGAGTFTEPSMASLAVGVSIIGAGQTLTIINCSYSFEVAGAGDFTKGSILLSSATVNTPGNQTLSDFTLDGGWTLTSLYSTTATRGICIVKRGNVTITRVTVQKFWVTGIGIYDGYPYTQPTIRADGNVLSYSTLYNNGNGYWAAESGYYGGACLEMFGQSNMLIHHNTMRNTDRPDRNSDLISRFDFCTGFKIYNNEFYKPETLGPNNLWNFCIETWNIQGGGEIYNNNFYGSFVPIDIGGPVTVKGTYDYSVKIYGNRMVRTTLYDANTGACEAISLESKTDCSDIYIFENYAENFGFALSIYDGSASEVNHKARIYYHNNIAVNSGWLQTWMMPIVNVSMVVGSTSTIEDLHIENNTFIGRSGKSQYGVSFFNVGTSNNIFIRNNIFYQLQNANLQGFVDMPLTKSTLTSGTRSNFTITNNLAFLTGNSNTVSYSGTISPYINANNIAVDPLFINPSILDYHLQLSSPAIDAGVDIGFPFLGLAPDLGAFESAPYRTVQIRSLYIPQGKTIKN
jgi:hypothetical protein